MSFTFRPATRENVGLILGVCGGTGSGKTYSAMRLAKGLAGGKRFAVIDTESGRAKHYADQFEFDHGDLAAPFEPDRYREAIVAADEAGYPVIVVDSFSHEHAGDGGLLDMHEAEWERLGGRENVKLLAWGAPKQAHKRMVSRLLQVRAHLILCFRAEEKIDIVREGGQTKVVPKKSLSGLAGWVPIAEKTLPYELTASFLLVADRPGIPQPIKLQEQHRPLVALDKPLDESVGERLAEWARGGSAPAPAKEPAKSSPTRFTLQGRKYETAGMTKEQMLESFRLVEEAARFTDAEEPKRALERLFPGKSSRLQLTEAEAARYLDELRALCGEPKAGEVA